MLVSENNRFEEIPKVYSKSVISVILGVLILLVAGLISLSIGQVLQGESLLLVRQIFVFVLPVIIPTIYTLIVLLIFYNRIINSTNFHKVFSYFFVFATISVLFSLLLNTDLTRLLQYLGFLTLPRFWIDMTAYAVIAPLVEELAKLLPLFVLSVSSIKVWGNKPKRVVENPSVLIFYAFIIGGMFTFLETLLYIYNTLQRLGVSTFDLLQKDVWDAVFAQIMIRFSFPLHIVTPVIMAFFIQRSLFNSRNLLPEVSGNAIGIGFVSGVILHSFWNGNLVFSAYNSQFPTILVYGSKMPVTVFWEGLLLWTILLVILVSVYLSDLPLLKCNVCGNFHYPPYSAKEHLQEQGELGMLYFISSFSSLRLSHLLKRVYYKLRKLPFSPGVKYCPNCSEVMTGITCENCESVPTFICKFCKFPVPVYANSCWNCKRELEVVFDQSFRLRQKPIEQIFLGIVFILTVFVYYKLFETILYFTFARNLTPAQKDILNFNLIFTIFFSLPLFFLVRWAIEKKSRDQVRVIGNFIGSLMVIETMFYIISLSSLIVAVGGIVNPVSGFLGTGFILILTVLLVLDFLHLLFQQKVLFEEDSV